MHWANLADDLATIQRPAHKGKPYTNPTHLGVLARVVVDRSMTYEAPVFRHACTSASYSTKLSSSIVPPRTPLVRNCQPTGRRKTLKPSLLTKCCSWPLPSVLRQRRPRSARAARPVRGTPKGGTPKVEPCDVHSREAHLGPRKRTGGLLPADLSARSCPRTRFLSESSIQTTRCLNSNCQKTRHLSLTHRRELLVLALQALHRIPVTLRPHPCKVISVLVTQS